MYQNSLTKLRLLDLKSAMRARSRRRPHNVKASTFSLDNMGNKKRAKNGELKINKIQNKDRSLETADELDPTRQNKSSKQEKNRTTTVHSSNNTKIPSNNETILSQCDDDISSILTKSKKQKRKNKDTEEIADLYTQKKSKKSKSDLNNDLLIDKSNMSQCDDDISSILSKSKKQKRKNKDTEEIADLNTQKKSKKSNIDSNNDLLIDKSNTNKNNATENPSNFINLKFLNKDEAEVKDEDIDNFCDELTEEDNKTYENWVQLFEANFTKNKKS